MTKKPSPATIVLLAAFAVSVALLIIGTNKITSLEDKLCQYETEFCKEE